MDLYEGKLGAKAELDMARIEELETQVGRNEQNNKETKRVNKDRAKIKELEA